MPVITPLAGTTEAPKQHKQPSRKGRKAWRKNVDVSEVEKGLEERSNQIIKGGVLVERDSKDLFQVAEEADLNILKQLPNKIKTLKADEILAQRSAVPAVPMRKRAGDKKTTDGVLPVKRQRATYITQKEVIRLRRVAEGHHDSTVAIVDADYDPWAVPAENIVAHVEDKFSFLPKAQKVKAPDTMTQAPISLAATGKPVPAIATPKPALSYNPVFTDYEARLVEEGRKAVEAEQKRLSDLEAERIREEAVARSAAEAEEAERRANLSEWEEDSAWEGFESGAEDVTAKRPKRKTPAQRNRINRRKEAEAKKKHDAINVRKAEQLKKIEQILAQEKEARQALQALGSSDDSDADGETEAGDDVVLRRRQLGKFKLPEPDLELVLPDELQDSLRLLKPEGNLLKDRYRSLLVRGKVEARRRRPYRKQAKTKVTEKWAHKDFHLF